MQSDGHHSERQRLARPLVMGVVNVTPDSFSDGGRYEDHEAAVAHGRALAAEGADWVDVGGESTRPGATGVLVAEELDRVLPVIEGLVAAHVPVSIDTRKPEVADAAARAGAGLLNDVSAELGPVAAEHGIGFVAMHMHGDPRTMQQHPSYVDVVAEVRDFLVDRAEGACSAGVEEVYIDPGIGFGKTFEHNLDLLANLDVLVATGFPVLVGTSRKTTLGILAARADGAAEPAAAAVGPHDRLEGSVTTAAWSFWRGAAMVRAHEVAATVRAAELVGTAGAVAA